MIRRELDNIAKSKELKINFYEHIFKSLTLEIESNTTKYLKRSLIHLFYNFLINCPKLCYRFYMSSRLYVNFKNKHNSILRKLSSLGLSNCLLKRRFNVWSFRRICACPKSCSYLYQWSAFQFLTIFTVLQITVDSIRACRKWTGSIC